MVTADSLAPQPVSVAISAGAKRGIVAYLAVSAVTILLMMIFGAIMRAAQAELIALDAGLFYRLMTVHGIGMVGVAALASSAIIWFFLAKHVRLSVGVLILNFALFLAGVTLILGAVFVGGFAGAWTFLYPLPAMSGGVWDTGAAAAYLIGLLLVGAGFLALFLDFGRAIIAGYGSLSRGLGWPQLFGRSTLPAPPPVVVAASMVVIVDVLCLLAGVAIVAANLVSLYDPGLGVDPLLAKNVTYFFGHTFINSTIYMAVPAVYEILPHYTGRPWKSSRVFLASWTGSTILVLIAFPHHLLMDFVMPTWMLVVGQVASYMNGLPILVVTSFSALAHIYRSGMRWDTTAALLVLAMFGWAAGVIPAILDATIIVNYVMHNTVWVPGHFHLYLLMGLLAMIYGFMYYFITEEHAGRDTMIDRFALAAYFIGSFGLSLTFLFAGKESVPRRWAAHLEGWLVYDRIGTAFSVIILAAVLVFTARFLVRVPRFMAR